jgi:hypothetical protein
MVMQTEPIAPTGARKLAAIMFTDIVGYSALAQRDDKLALALLEELKESMHRHPKGVPETIYYRASGPAALGKADAWP